MTLSKAIAERIRELLKENNMTQYQLFKETGVPQSTISTILKEVDKTCKLNTIAHLVAGFHIGLREFFAAELFSAENIED